MTGAGSSNSNSRLCIPINVSHARCMLLRFTSITFVNFENLSKDASLQGKF